MDTGPQSRNRVTTGEFPPAVPRSLCTDCGISRSSDPKACGRACQFIKPDYDSLERKVHGRARDPQRQREIDTCLAHNRQHSPLFDTRMFCRHLEAIYTSIWRQQQLGGIQDELGS